MEKGENPMYFRPLEMFLMNEQPFTCPHCGSRCEEIASFYHTNAKTLIQECRNAECKFIGIENEEKYFLKLWEVI